MRKALIVVVALLGLSASALAGEPKKPKTLPPSPLEPARGPKRLVFRPWMFPPYVVLGLPRDIFDAPPKLLSSIPLFNKVFLAPLMVINSFTTSLCWSFTEEGTEGGYAAWVECLGLPRKPGALPHAKIPFYMRYGPNWRSFGTLYWKPRPAPPKPPEGPPPKSPSPPPPTSVEPPQPPPR